MGWFDNAKDLSHVHGNVFLQQVAGKKKLILQKSIFYFHEWGRVDIQYQLWDIQSPHVRICWGSSSHTTPTSKPGCMGRFLECGSYFWESFQEFLELIVIFDSNYHCANCIANYIPSSTSRNSNAYTAKALFNQFVPAANRCQRRGFKFYSYPSPPPQCQYETMLFICT